MQERLFPAIALDKEKINLGPLLQVGTPVMLKGGLRCTTVKQELSCEIIIKQGSYQEFARQKKYNDHLPIQFQKLFPTILQLTSTHRPGEGLMLMEKFPGISFHSFVFDTTLKDDLKLKTLKKVLQKLSSMHIYDCGQHFITRDLRTWIKKIFSRLNKLPSPSVNLDQILPLLKYFESKTLVDHVIARHIHGDAQAGNFMIHAVDDLMKVKFIDPLGGSGRSPGDYVYDLSRLYHWIDCAGLCYELENETTRTYLKRHNAFLKIRDRANRSILRALSVTAQVLKDPHAQFWFYIYGAHHVSGKLNNFRSPRSQSVLSTALAYYLKKAVGFQRRRKS